jgi:UDP-glucose 4-epimerase
MEAPQVPKRIVVLGASGFLGAAMTTHLAELGHHVIAYCRHHQNLASARSNVTHVTADLRDTWILADVFKRADVVYHFASATHPSLFFSNPSAEYWEALQPLLVMMETAARAGVKKIVYPSSGGTIYADSSSPRFENSPTSPMSPYAIMKLAAEQLLHHSARLGHFSVDVFRIGNPYGPGQRMRPGQGVLPHWIDAIQKNHPLKVFGDGTAVRDYVFIDDLCKLMSQSLNWMNENNTFNLGTGTGTSLNELLKLIRTLVNKPIEVEYLEGRASDVRSVVLASDQILSRIPEFQFASLKEGLKQTLSFHGVGQPDSRS